MFPLTAPQWVAAGNTPPCRFLTPTGANFTADVAGNNAVPLIGVSYESSRYAPGTPGDDGFVAIAGESIPYYSPGMIAHVTLGGNVTFGKYVTATTGGNAVLANLSANGPQWISGLSQGNGLTGEKIPVWILSFAYNGLPS